MEEKLIKVVNSRGGIYYYNKKYEYHNINDKPAVISSHGFKVWYKNGFRHRTKGPATVSTDGSEFWWYEGIDITSKVNQMMEEGLISSDWQNWTEEDEFLFVLLVS